MCMPGGDFLSIFFELWRSCVALPIYGRVYTALAIGITLKESGIIWILHLFKPKTTLTDTPLAEKGDAGKGLDLEITCVKRDRERSPEEDQHVIHKWRCYTGAWTQSTLSQFISPFLWFFFFCSLTNYLPGLALNFNPLDLCLLSS
jgi:hypothetical protein